MERVVSNPSRSSRSSRLGHSWDSSIVTLRDIAVYGMPCHPRRMPVGASIAFISIGGLSVAQLMVRNLPNELVLALKQRAAKRNRSAEQEHREILKAALQRPRRRALADVLASMPNVGDDEDFARRQADRRS